MFFPWTCLLTVIWGCTLRPPSFSAPTRWELHSQTRQSLPVVDGQSWEGYQRFAVLHVSHFWQNCILILILAKFCLCFLPLLLFWHCTVLFVVKCHHGSSHLCVQLAFKVQRNMDSFVLPTNVLHFFSCRFCVKFAETLASCSSKVMCLQGCVSLSPDCI